MIIDFHAHIFPDKIASKVIPHLQSLSHTQAYTDGTLSGLSQSMARANVQYSVLQPVATTAKQVISCNDFARQVNEQHQNILSFGAMHPDFEGYQAELKRMKAMGIKGVKLHPNYQQAYFDDIRYKRIVETASSLGLIVLIHAGVDIGLPDPTYATPRAIKNVIDDVHPTHLVLAHMGGWQCWGDVIDILGGEDVYLDTSFSLGTIQYLPDIPQDKQTYAMMSDPLFLKALNAFGAGRILFGSDSPWGDPYDTLLHLQNMPLSEEQRTKILGQNAWDLLGL